MNDSQRTTSAAPSWTVLLASILGGILIFGLGRTLVDAHRRANDAPLKALLGDTEYPDMLGDLNHFPHYVGNNKTAPDFSLIDEHGKKVSLSDLRGSKVVLNFWTRTCKPCLEEMPSLERLARQVQQNGDNVKVVLVSTDNGMDAVVDVLAPKRYATYLFDPTSSIVRDKFGTKYFPETWIIDEQGVIRMRYDGAVDWSDPLAYDVIKSL